MPKSLRDFLFFEWKLNKTLTTVHLWSMSRANEIFILGKKHYITSLRYFHFRIETGKMFCFANIVCANEKVFFFFFFLVEFASICANKKVFL